MNNERFNMQNQTQQMELGFNPNGNLHITMRRPRRMAGAHWWFNQMRSAVNRAVDWHTAPAAPPAQAHITLAPQPR
jgi:hypothetical protein